MIPSKHIPAISFQTRNQNMGLYNYNLLCKLTKPTQQTISLASNIYILQWRNYKVPTWPGEYHILTNTQAKKHLGWKHYNLE